MNKYKEMFDKINISDECLRKVEHMEKNNHKIKKFRIRYVAVAAVMLAIFAMTDVVSYAATGNGITKHVLRIAIPSAFRISFRSSTIFSLKRSMPSVRA